MAFEQSQMLFEDYEQGYMLRPSGCEMSVTFPCTVKENRRYRLFVVGETTLFYQWKDEPDGPMQYRTVCDALDTENARESRYCLDLSSKQPERYVRRVYKKVMWPPQLSYLAMHPVPDQWKAGIWAKAEGLHIENDGFLRMRIDIRYKHDGVDIRSVTREPDESHCIDLPEGSWDWQAFLCELEVSSENTAHIGVWLEGQGYSGKLYVEHPFLQAPTGENLLPEFDTPVSDKEQFDWTAQNLSRKEWPEFDVRLNGEQIFHGEVFERSHRCSEWEIDVPTSLLQTENELEIYLVSEYHDPLPYRVQEIRLLDQPYGAVALIAASEIGSVQDGAYVLVRTAQDNTRFLFGSDQNVLHGENEYYFEKAGLHGIHLRCLRPSLNAAFTLTCNGVSVQGCIQRIVERQPDSVLTGTGDMIYIEQRLDYVEEFLCWYVANHVGNLLTIRPVYRWSGSRTVVPEVWEVVKCVLSELGIQYVLMMDGRELPGLNANPDDAMLASTCYRGHQLHERDGAAYYWNTRKASASPMSEQYGDMIQYTFKEDPKHTSSDHAPENFFYVHGDVYNFRDPLMKRDNRIGMEESLKFLKSIRLDTPRHTGPSVMFKYLFAAGYQWLGAETMYGSMEPLMAFLRGACAMQGIAEMGVHHAVQWSSSPQDAPEHFRRFRLALYVSYMQGATEINTEEGLWHLEEYYSHFHRFSEGCKGHQQPQQDFYRYVASHSRTGSFYTPMGLLHGRYDGWHAFGNHHPWGWQDAPNGDAEKSWDLLKVFYPLSKPGDALYIHGCSTDHAVGYHTGTPMANVDVLPVESGIELLKKYKVLAFMGYHCAQPGDAAKLSDYVNNGGQLLLTRAHLTDTTDFYDVLNYRIKESDDLQNVFSDGTPEYVENHVKGCAVKVCTNIAVPDRVIMRTDEGLPLVCEYDLGSGTVALVNALAYPSHPAVRPIYEQLLEQLMRNQLEQEAVWSENGDDVGSAVYKQEDGSTHIYFMAVDWFRPEELTRRAVLRIDENRYIVELPFGVMLKCVIAGDCAAWPHTENGGVLSVGNKTVCVQGTGKVAFTLARAGAQREVVVDFSEKPIQELTF